MRAPARTVVLVALVLAAFATGAAAQPPPGPDDDARDQARFAQATQRLGDGDLAGARAALEALAAASPQGRWADDALSEAAGIAERQGDLAGARTLWTRLLASYPDSRLARRARARLAELTAAGGASGEWDAVAAEHDRLVRASAVDDPAPALRALGELLDRNAGYSRWYAAALWLGDAWVRAGDRPRALAWYERASAAARTDLERFRAGLARGQLWAASGEYDRAEAALRALAPPDALSKDARDDAIAEVAKARDRARLALVAKLVLAACLLLAIVTIRRRAGSWRAAARALWPPPVEVIFLIPVAGVLAMVARSGNLMAARAVEIILVGGFAISWLSGAGLELARRRGGPGAAVIAAHVAAVLAASAALIYVAVMHEQLLDLLAETWHHGHDMR